MPDLSDYVPAELPNEEPPQREAPPLPDDRRRAPGTDDVLPASIESEKTVLGSILLDQVYFNEAAEFLQPSDFSLDSHQRIFTVMSELIDANKAVDVVTVCEELVRRKWMEQVGGWAYVASLNEGLPLKPQIANYVSILKDKAMLRRMMLIFSAAITRAADQSDPAMAVLEEAESRLLEIAQESVGGKLTTFADHVQAVGGVEDYLKPIVEGRARTGLSSGFYDVDRITGGMHKGELTIIAARPSMGKTALGINIASNCSIDMNAVVAFFSLEMTKESLFRRLLASIGRVNVSKVVSSEFVSSRDHEGLYKAVTKLIETNLFIDDTAAITPVAMRAKARRLKQKMGKLDLIVVDYLQLMTLGERSENRRVEVGKCSKALKAMAKELDVPVVALAQVARSSEGRSDKRPVLSDLRESGDIEQDSDVVHFIHRPSYYERDEEMTESDRALAEIITAKNREGPTDTERLIYIAPFTCFMNMAKGE